MYLKQCIVLLVLGLSLTACKSSDENDAQMPADQSSDSTLPQRSIVSNWVAPTCAAGFMAVVGEVDCQPIGSACPGDGWPVVEPTQTSVVYVKPGGSGDGTSPTSPLGSIGQAMMLISDEGLIVLGSGTYPESFEMSRPIHIIGACASQTIITATSQTSPVISIPGSGAALTNITIEGGSPGVTVNQDATATLTGIDIHNSNDYGLSIETGASVEVSDSLIRNILASQDENGGNGGSGIKHTGTRLVLERVSIQATANTGLFTDGASDTLLSDVFISETGTENNPDGFALENVSSSSLTAQRLVIENNHGVGLGTFVGGAISLSDTVIRNNARHGITTAAMQQVEMHRTEMINNHSIAWVIIGKEMVVNATDVIITDTQPDTSVQIGCDGADANANRHPGYGIVQFSGALSLNRFEISSNQSAGLVLFDSSEQQGFMELFRGVPQLTATDGLITQNLIGVNIQIENFDLDAAFDNVLNYDNTAQDLSMENLSLPSYGQLTEDEVEGTGNTENTPALAETCPDNLVCFGLGRPSLGICTMQGGDLPGNAARCRCSAFCGCEQACPSGMDCVDLDDAGPFEQTDGTCATMCSNPTTGPDDPGGPGGPSGDNPWSQYGPCDEGQVCNPFQSIEQFACTNRCGEAIDGATACSTAAECQPDETCVPGIEVCARLCDPETQYPSLQPDANGCIELFAGDGGCDAFQNNTQCNWDGGDCCPSTCVDCVSSCGEYGYDCQDPSAQ